jgi:phage terminase large subunit
MVSSVKGANSVNEGVEFLKGYDIIVHPRCKHVIDELATYSYEVDKKTDDVLPTLADKKNHTIDSLRYAVEGIRRANPPAVFGSYGNK